MRKNIVLVDDFGTRALTVRDPAAPIMRMAKGLGLILAIALLPAISLASSPIDAALEVPESWSAPPYWSPPTVSPEARSGRSALAAGRQPLVTSPVPLPFVAVAPCRIIDTRASQGFAFFLGSAFASGIRGRENVPGRGAVRYSGGRQGGLVQYGTVVGTAAAGNLRFFPAGGVTPLVSTIKFSGGHRSLANAAVMSLRTHRHRNRRHHGARKL